jgi:2-polyprenyl-6-methoxyphenol hydroxylase-like FAD-dependent oxidoreductase
MVEGGRSGSRRLRRLLPAPEPFPFSWPSYVTFIQPDLERVLRERARQMPNVEFRLSSEVISIGGLDGSPSVTVRQTSTGQREELHCKYVVGCDGGNSFVRKAMDAKIEDLDFDEPWLVIDMLLRTRRASRGKRTVLRSGAPHYLRARAGSPQALGVYAAAGRETRRTDEAREDLGAVE